MDERKMQRKAIKKAYKKARRKAIQPWKFFAILCLVLTLILVPAGVVLGMFDNAMAAFMGGDFWDVQNEDPNAIYFAEEFNSHEERPSAIRWKLKAQPC